MRRTVTRWVLGIALIVPATGNAPAVTREIADLQSARTTFDQSILNRLSHDTYRDPFDELQTRPYNLLFNNSGRHANLSPWQGQEGSYTRYVNALIGNNGATNVDNDADTIQGALVRRETAAFSWGFSGSFLVGNDGGNDTSGTAGFSDNDDLQAYGVRVGAALQMSERRVLGAGARVVTAGRRLTDESFEQGVGGFRGADEFDQTSLQLDVGLRHFLSRASSWETQIVVGLGSSTQDEFSENLDDAGNVTDRFVIADYDLSDISVGLYGGFNRLRSEGLGETEYRVGLERSQRELDNTELAFSEDAGGRTPSLVLLGQDTIATTRAFVSARKVFRAGETEMFTGASLAHGTVSGATRVDASGTILDETIDDATTQLGLTLGLRQPFFHERFRFIVSGRADLLDEDRATTFDTGSTAESRSRSTTQYAVGVEGVLANVTLDLAWLRSEEAPVVPVELGLPAGSRRSIALDRVVFSAAVAW